ncbi:peptide chain release factor N(5)-glutamine methyltransferase [Bacteroidales bacterium OttesenSCG-928-M06]|nr:peptide chain release factor N(5)-glutamine methyltransferase [Bacteroidales bacterium OttesenSCG-928-M06]
MQKALSYISAELSDLYSESEIHSFSYLILEHICKKDKHILLRDKDNQLSINENFLVREFIEKLKEFQPIQYLLGKTEFYGLSFIVNKNVLIPRPETEELIELILSSINNSSPFILDIGTGSGCIAVSLAKYLPNAHIYGLDISKDALETASKNALLNEVLIHFTHENILELPSDSPIRTVTWDVIVSNPPYIIPSEKKNMSKNVLEYEPSEALFVPENQPLLFYEKIADIGLNCLHKNGKLFFETSALFGKDTAEMLKRKGYTSVELYKDISGNDRMIKASIQ